eukprot:4661186-Pyramimonas_sp.AAC.1
MLRPRPVRPTLSCPRGVPRTSRNILSSDGRNLRPPTTVHTDCSVKKVGTSAKLGSASSPSRPRHPSTPSGSAGGR